MYQNKVLHQTNYNMRDKTKRNILNEPHSLAEDAKKVNVKPAQHAGKAS